MSVYIYISVYVFICIYVEDEDSFRKGLANILNFIWYAISSDNVSD